VPSRVSSDYRVHSFIEMQTGTSVDVEGVIQLDGTHALQASMFLL